MQILGRVTTRLATQSQTWQNPEPRHQWQTQNLLHGLTDQGGEHHRVNNITIGGSITNSKTAVPAVISTALMAGPLGAINVWTVLHVDWHRFQIH